ncbi:MAG: SRPBCC domain-containing protein [Sneathiellaceae bacterium]
MKQVRTEAFIAAAPLQAWQVLADFDGYAAWNPLNVRAHGRAAPGARVAMSFRNPARPGSVIEMTVTVTECEPGRRLEWRGRIPLLFTGRHHFRLAPEGTGTRLDHGEDLSGLIPALIGSRRIGRQFGPAYEAVNAALADRVAVLAASGGVA